MAETSTAKKYVALFLWLFAAAMFLSLAVQWIEFSSSDKQFTEYVQSALQRAALDRRPPTEVRNQVLVKAAQLSIPLEHGRLKVSGQGGSIETSFAYDAEIKIPVLDHVVYRMEFSHLLIPKPLY
jgi:hypothetical protein